MQHQLRQALSITCLALSVALGWLWVCSMSKMDEIDHYSDENTGRGAGGTLYGIGSSGGEVFVGYVKIAIAADVQKRHWAG